MPDIGGVRTTTAAGSQLAAALERADDDSFHGLLGTLDGSGVRVDDLAPDEMAAFEGLVDAAEATEKAGLS